MPLGNPDPAVQTPGTDPAPAQPVNPQTITIPLDQLNAFTAMQTRLAKMEADQAQRDQAAKEAEVRLMAEKGKVEEALRLQREEADQRLNTERLTRTQLEERAKRYALDGELSRVLAGQPLVEGGADQLTELWRNKFTVEAQGDSFAVRTPGYQTVQEFVTGQLSDKRYSHFLRAQNPQGGTAGGMTSGSLAQPTNPANPAEAPKFRNFGEAIVAQVQASRQQLVDPSLDPRLPFGLPTQGMINGGRAAAVERR
jgi:hypothetical protein